MKERELRIGNWVRVGNIESVVDEITEELIHVEGNWLRNRIDQIEPIPLTEEWLLKFGFHEMISNEGYFIFALGESGRVSFEDADFIFHLQSGFIQAECAIDIHSIGVKIQYVHEFQNAFKVLTGKELVI